MTWLVNKKTGDKQWVPQQHLAKAKASGLYEDSGDARVVVRDDAGELREVEASAAANLGVDVVHEGEAQEARGVARVKDERSTIGQQAITAVEGGLAGITLGGSRHAANFVLGDDYQQAQAEREDVNEGLALGSEVVGGIAAAFATGGATAPESVAATGGRIAAKTLAKRVLAKSPAALAERAGVALGKKAGGGIKGVLARGASEGGIVGFGEGVNRLALEEDVDVEKAVSVLSSNALYGVGFGGAASVVASAAGKGLVKARKMAGEAAERFRKPASIGDDLAAMDRAGLREAKKTATKEAREAIRQDRMSMVEELDGYYKASKESYPWKATDFAASSKSLDDLPFRELAVQNKKARSALRAQLNAKKSIADNPGSALKALVAEEQALETLIAKTDEIKDLLPKKGLSMSQVSDRTKALATAPDQLVSNRRIQESLRASSDAWMNPTSQRLDDIGGALDSFSERNQKGFIRKSAESVLTAGGTMTLAPVMGFTAAGLASAKAGEAAGDLVFGRLAKAGNEASLRISSAVEKFVDATSKAGKRAPPVAAKVLTRVSYGEPEKDQPPTPKGEEKAVTAFRSRERELRNQVAPGPDGSVKMTRAARSALSDRLAGVRMLSPVSADRMETVAARRIEFLASKLPKRPDIAMMGNLLAPHDTWRPSDFEVAEFARFVAAVEDPAEVVERLIDGSVTPEDGEALRTVYPELFASIQQQIISELPKLRKQLPFSRRLALSIFSDVAVDPSMDPRIIRVLQGNFASEEGTEGGVQPPQAQPQFGSLSREESTPAQERMG